MDYVKEPNVNLEILSYRPVNFFIEGEVNRITHYYSESENPNELYKKPNLPSLLDVIKESGD